MPALVRVTKNKRLAGTCVNVGCIPKMLLVYASHYGADFEDAAAYGWTVGPRSFDWARLIENKDHEIKRLNGVYGGILETNHVEIIMARAASSIRTLEVDGAASRRAILVATGGAPFVPPGTARAPSWARWSCSRLVHGGLTIGCHRAASPLLAS